MRIWARSQTKQSKYGFVSFFSSRLCRIFFPLLQKLLFHLCKFVSGADETVRTAKGRNSEQEIENKIIKKTQEMYFNKMMFSFFHEYNDLDSLNLKCARPRYARDRLQPIKLNRF